MGWDMEYILDMEQSHFQNRTTLFTGKSTRITFNIL